MGKKSEDEDDEMNPLDELINSLPSRPADEEKKEEEAKSEDEEEEEDDPLMDVAVKATEAAKAEKEKVVGLPAAASMPQSAKPRKEELMAKKADDLKAMCRARGLAVSGTKAVLVDRLMAAQ